MHFLEAWRESWSLFKERRDCNSGDYEPAVKCIFFSSFVLVLSLYLWLTVLGDGMTAVCPTPTLIISHTVSFNFALYHAFYVPVLVLLLLFSHSFFPLIIFCVFVPFKYLSLLFPTFVVLFLCVFSSVWIPTNFLME